MKRIILPMIALLMATPALAEKPFPMPDEHAIYCLSIAGQYKHHRRTTPYMSLLRKVNEIEMTTADLEPISFWLAAGRRDGKLYKMCRDNNAGNKASLGQCPDLVVYPDTFKECKKFLGR